MENQEAEQPLQIIISLNRDRTINVAGSVEVMHDKMIAYGMLEVAKEAISKLSKPQIETATPAQVAQAAKLKLV